jgi:hypothetical protein
MMTPVKILAVSWVVAACLGLFSVVTAKAVEVVNAVGTFQAACGGGDPFPYCIVIDTRTGRIVSAEYAPQVTKK